MKKFIFYLSNCILITFLLFLTTCDSSNVKNNIQENQFEVPSIVFGEGAKIGTFKLPDGTRINQVEKGFNFSFPDGYQLAYISEFDKLTITDEGEYQCACTGNGGCSNFWSEKTGFGCAQSTCDATCEGKFVEPEILKTGIVMNKKEPYKFITSLDEANKLFVAKSTLMKIPEVIETVEKLNLKYFGKETVSEEDFQIMNCSLVALSLYGNLVAYSMPNGTTKSINGIMKVTAECECTGTGGGTSDEDCKKAKKTVVGGVWTCPNITCSVCKMTIIQQQ